ncbi:MAG: Asp-tRNA(Asn)/Glu-tRNA(Gln) amidotransferase subunit GatC [bacterium]
MSISKEQVVHIAKLARLKLTLQEIEEFSKQLSDILLYMEKLNELNTENIKPLSHILPIQNVVREDEEKESLAIEDVLKNAPDKENNFIKVPKILETE